ncbi:hypothetical protein GCM10009864_73450 [Streptomyces lunalinharesii]|uniref:Uncharacterized protein n=1 Tax=Streptomyces lunalinharesii TaxID=333384 RepID=A0ABN3SXT5_9ACTN
MAPVPSTLHLPLTLTNGLPSRTPSAAIGRSGEAPDPNTTGRQLGRRAPDRLVAGRPTPAGPPAVPRANNRTKILVIIGGKPGPDRPLDDVVRHLTVCLGASPRALVAGGVVDPSPVR